MKVPFSSRPWAAGIHLAVLLLTASLWVGCQDGTDASGPSTQENTVKNSSVASKCSDLLEPVCGADGVSYRNSCAATMVGETTVASKGICPTDPDPIGVDPGPGLGGFDPTCKEVFPSNIAIKCMSTLDPVCGCDGKTYRNSCVANGAGHVYAKAKGACPGQPYVEE